MRDGLSVANSDSILISDSTGGGCEKDAAASVSQIEPCAGSSVKRVAERDSSIELLRIVAMAIIVAHHYVVSSGVSDIIGKMPELTTNAIFLSLFGSMGKTAVNCFLLITGYFMCKSKMTLRKFLKLLLQVEFYNIAAVCFFILVKNQTYNFKSLFVALTPFYGIGRYFTPSIVPFFLFIPFLNLLIKGMNKKQHIGLLGLCLLIYSILPSVTIPPFFPHAIVNFGYISWFSVVYLIASYIRLYPEPLFEDKKLWGIAALFSIVLAFISVIWFAGLARAIGSTNFWFSYFLIADSHKILCVTTSICVFMFFKNLRIKHSTTINTIATYSFGVLLIHTTGRTRRFVWHELLENTSFLSANLHTLIIHAVYSVILIYAAGTLFDMLRVKLFEEPLFKLYDRRFAERKNGTSAMGDAG